MCFKTVFVLLSAFLFYFNLHTIEQRKRATTINSLTKLQQEKNAQNLNNKKNYEPVHNKKYVSNISQVYFFSKKKNWLDIFKKAHERPYVKQGLFLGIEYAF